MVCSSRKWQPALSSRAAVGQARPDIVFHLAAQPLVRAIGTSVCRMKSMQRSRWAGTINRHAWLRYVNDWEIVAWLVFYVPYLVVKHAMPIPSYYNSTMIFLKPLEDLWIVWMFPYLMLMNSSRTARLRRVQSSFLKQPWRTWRSGSACRAGRA